MKIGELSRHTGVSARLLRYYEEQGLLASVRTEGGHRHYGADAPETVAHIRALLDARVPTRTIRELLPCVEGEGPSGPRINACVSGLLRDHLEAMERQIAELQQSRTALTGILTA
ncbi:MerR family transcriptional regulator [Nonomuraea soli]|uniref:DNA-binding transcriptional MerR regulator n=1 Tax=Nonomuraea soli TaxID=1032476 RepID=A0A7W0CDZ4_9ACTN|nr:MerR family transcriptional regulator [Nonomuraea soli]MBA2889384.1 DNA-binding transcriptional MerR regulator [Nonomuraea soli]